MSAISDSRNHPPRVTQPAEWETHEAVWLAWPSAEDLWEENTAPARQEFIALCEAIADVDPRTGKARGEKLHILVPDETQKALAQSALRALSPEFHLIPFGDIWLRDTGPIFVRSEKDEILAHCFGFNGWGEKYILDHDTEVSGKISAASKKEKKSFSWILEGGSIEANGKGTCLTSRQCLLNPNRNKGVTEKTVETQLAEALGHSRVIWLEKGLVNDHTDGHIDTIARFVAEDTVLCMKAKDARDPNFEAMEEIEKDLRKSGLKVLTIPSPGKITDEEENILAASYLNFYIANTTVVVPTYGSPEDAAAVAEIAKCFPGRKTVGRSARAILSGGGAFHCISQQQPV